jgi:hypothetical protein
MRAMIQDDPQLWVAILDAAQEHHEAELADIAISLYGELGEARAEISRLRASLQSSLRHGLTRPAVRPVPTTAASAA